MKRNLYAILLCVLVLTMFASTAFASDEQSIGSDRNEPVICTGVEFVCENSTRDLIWQDDGGREQSGYKERVWGWSTCTNSIGTNVEHYTRARYENRITSEVYQDSGRVWGTGKVWAYSPWEDKSAAQYMSARVYYGT